MDHNSAYFHMYRQGKKDMYVNHFLAFAEKYSQPIPEHYQALENKHEDLILAINYAYAEKKLDVVRRFLLAIGDYLYVRGYWQEYHEWLTRVILLSDEYDDEYDDEIIDLTAEMADLARDSGDYNLANQLCERNLNICKKLADEKGIADTLYSLGRLAHNINDYTKANEFYQKGMEIATTINYRPAIANILHRLGMLAKKDGDYEKTLEFYQQSLAIRQELGIEVSISQSFHALGTLSLTRKNHIPSN